MKFKKISYLDIFSYIDAKTKESVLWTGYEEKDHIIMPGEDVRLVNGFFIFNLDTSDKEFKVYVWNMDKKPLIINNMSFYKAKNGPYFYRHP